MREARTLDYLRYVLPVHRYRFVVTVRCAFFTVVFLHAWDFVMLPLSDNFLRRTQGFCDAGMARQGLSGLLPTPRPARRQGLTRQDAPGQFRRLSPRPYRDVKARAIGFMPIYQGRRSAARVRAQ